MKKIKQAILLIFLTSLSFTFLNALQSNSGITGKWNSENNESVILLEEKNGKINGKIVELKDPNDPDGTPKKDKHNPKPELRDKPIVGLTILTDLKTDGNNTWTGGRIYDPRTGHSYKCEMKLDGDVLKIRGYMGIKMLGKTTTWTRAK